MKSKIKYLIYAIVAVVLFTNYSCSDDDINSADMRVYLKAKDGSAYSTRTCTPGLNGLNEGNEVKINIQATRGLAADAYLKVVIDESLVEDFKNQTNLDLPILPKANYTLTNNGDILMKQGESAAPLSIELIGVENLRGTEDENPKYLLPIKLESVRSADKGLVISETYNTYFVVLELAKFSNMTELPNGFTIPALDKTDWVVSQVGGVQYLTNDIDKVLDDKTYTSWVSTEIVHDVIIDMKQVNELKGLFLYSSFADGGWGVNRKKGQIGVFDVYTSVDNSTWTLHGQCDPLGYTTVRKNLEFMTPVEARYLKIHIYDIPGNTYSSIAEINLY